MELDRDRLRAILEADHSYYGSHAPESRIDDRLAPGASDFIASQLSPDMRVLDVGCGSGATLLDNGDRFASGLGIDDDPAHVRLAEEALRRSGRDNVEFRLLDFPEDGHELEAESFDFVFSERGPIGYDSYGIQAALRVLKDDGLLFCEMIGNLHHQEVAAVFGPGVAAQPDGTDYGPGAGCHGAQRSQHTYCFRDRDEALLPQHLRLAAVPVWHMGLARRIAPIA